MTNAKWLSKDEWLILEACKLMVRSGVGVSYSVQSAKKQIATLESLAAQRELMKKHETVLYFNGIGNVEVCPECGCGKFAGKAEHTPDCAWAKHIDGFPRKVDSDG